MGSWGITMRQSDYGLDPLGTIVDTPERIAVLSLLTNRNYYKSQRAAPATDYSFRLLGRLFCICGQADDTT